MRIIIDISEGRNAQKRKCIRVRAKYYANSDDGVRVRNYAMAIYNSIREGFEEGADDKLVEFLDEVT